ncbi:Ig-like domain-containing protein [Bradyrhizobium sp. STM 3562]|uniref:Ig-like domain-containing protein n=1 Tax=Bradyrhizobium sp. STM 3562 TaxID=578924 RepID=UPI00388FB9FA
MTIENCRIDANGGYYNIDAGATNNASGLKVTNCTLLNSAGGNVNGSNILCTGATITGNDMSGMSHCISSDGGNLIQNNYMHDLNGTPDGHYECIYIGGGAPGDTINHNTMISFDTADVFMKTDYGPVNNCVVTDNLMLQQTPVPVAGLHTTSYNIYLDNTGAGMSGNVVSGNIMQKGYYGYSSVTNAGVNWQNNTDISTGQTISVDGTLSSAAPTGSSAPAAPVISSFSPDSGVSGDGITSANKLDLKGTAAPNSTVTVYDGGAKIGTTTASSTGSWDYITSVLTDAKHMLTATATANGQTSAASAALSVTVDTHAPAAPVLTSATVDNTNHVLLAGTAEANSSITVYDGTTVVGTGTTSSSGAFSITTSVLSGGTHALTAKATDAAGNISAASQALDPVIGGTTTPTPPATSPGAPKIVSFSPDSGVAGDGVTNINKVTVSGTAEANTTIKVFDGTTQIGTATVDGNGQWSLSTPALNDGAHHLTATDTDSSGHTSAASAALSVTVDTHAPGAPTMAAYSQAGSTVGSTTTLSDLVLKGTAEANSTIDVFDGGKQIGTATTSSGGSWSFDTGHLANGSHNFTAKAIDVAGNTSAASAADAVTVATSTIPTPPSSTKSIDFTDVSENWSNHSATIKGTADAYSHVKVSDGNTVLGTVTANAKGNWSFTTSPLSDTLHTFKAQEVDSSGHVVATSSGAAMLAGSHTSVMTGTGGNDFMYSSTSQLNDTFVFDSNFGHSTVQGFTVAGAGHDTIQFSKSVFDSFADVLSHASQVGHDVVISAGNDTLTLTNTKVSALNSHDFHFA